jgi:2-methylisocitrate lyase-like PEP mutase family enzyme
METRLQDIERLDEAVKRAKAFLDAGGDPSTEEAAPLGKELAIAFDAVAKNFRGSGILTDL